MNQDSSLDKAKQRAAGIAARRALSDEVRARANEAIARRVCASEAFAQAEYILSYRAVRGEADPAAIDDEARRRGKQVAYPISLGGGFMLAAVPERLVRGMYGIEEPAIRGCRVLSPLELDLILTPCAAFDDRCGRVGMGAGYYDRFLPRCSRAVSVALAFEVQRVPVVAEEDWDCPLSAAATEQSWYQKE